MVKRLCLWLRRSRRLEEIGRQEIYDQKITSVDIVCGIAASGRTPYVLGVLKEAQKNGISTIFITTVQKNNYVYMQILLSIYPLVQK